MANKKKSPTSYQVELSRLQSNNNALRTPTVKGVASELPKVGVGFIMTGASLTPGAAFRLIHTSEVTEVGELVDGLIDFDTLNSSYVLEILPDEEEE